MQTGLQVSLSSQGNNTVDVRALLLSHDIRLPSTRRLENDEADSEGEVHERTAAQLDVYEAEDGFIDDDDVVADGERIVVPKAKDGGEGEGIRGGIWKRGGGGIARVVVGGQERVRQGFYVNRGEIEMRAVRKRKKGKGKVKGKSKEEGGGGESPVGDDGAPGKAVAQTVTAKGGVQAAAGKVGVQTSAAGDGGGIIGVAVGAGEKRKATEVAVGSGGGIGGAGGAPLKRKKSAEVEKLPEEVLVLVEKLRTLCKDIYKDKKPEVNKSAPLQEVLDTLIGKCRKADICKLVMEKHVVVIGDALWKELDFLRTTRANLETLSWALVWDAVESDAKESVSVADGNLRKAVRGKALGQVDKEELRDLVVAWWKARITQLEATNKLGEQGKEKSVRKLHGSWLDALAKICGSQETGVTRDVIASVVKEYEDGVAADERARKESEKFEREEKRAAKAAKKKEREQAATDAKLRAATAAGNVSAIVSAKPSILSQLDSIKKTKNGGGGGGQASAALPPPPRPAGPTVGVGIVPAARATAAARVTAAAAASGAATVTTSGPLNVATKATTSAAAAVAAAAARRVADNGANSKAAQAGYKCTAVADGTQMTAAQAATALPAAGADNSGQYEVNVISSDDDDAVSLGSEWKSKAQPADTQPEFQAESEPVVIELDD